MITDFYFGIKSGLKFGYVDYYKLESFKNGVAKFIVYDANMMPHSNFENWSNGAKGEVVQYVRELFKGFDGYIYIDNHEIDMRADKRSTSSKVNDWFFEKGLDLADPMAQFTKLVEEVAELGVAIIKEEEDEIIDALGDIQVVLHGLSLQLEVNLAESLEAAYNVIKDRKGKLVNGIWVKEEDL